MESEAKASAPNCQLASPDAGPCTSEFRVRAPEAEMSTRLTRLPPEEPYDQVIQATQPVPLRKAMTSLSTFIRPPAGESTSVFHDQPPPVRGVPRP